MMDTSLLKGKRIIYYPGSFDLPHRGHVEAVREALIQTKADLAIVRADDVDNTWKPQRLAWEIRTEMLKRTFKEFSNVIVATFRKNQVKEMLQDHYVIALIGSDIWPRYQKKKNAVFVKEVVISSRGDEDGQATTGYHLPVTYIWPKIRDCSSTKIRTFLKIRDIDAIRSLVHPDVIDLVIRNGLYLDDENRGRFIEEQIRLSLGGELVSLNKKSVSGDLTFLSIKENQSTYFVKAFVYSGGSLDDSDSLRRYTHPLRRMESEIRGLELMNHANLTYGTAPQIIQTIRHEYGGYLVETCVKGEDLATCGKRYDQQEAFGTMCYLVGQALHELHAMKHLPVDPTHMEAWITRMEQKIHGFLTALRPRINIETFEELEASFKRLLVAYRLSPGDYTYVHGDANLGNFFVTLSNDSCDLSEKRVTFVDLNSMGTAMDDSNNPRGFPAYEYHQFLASVIYWGVSNGIPEHIIKHAQDRFIQGYGSHDTFTKEASDFYGAYWDLRSALCRLDS